MDRPLGILNAREGQFEGRWLRRKALARRTEDAIMERSKGQEWRGSGGSVEEVRVDAVVTLVQGDANAAVIGPGAGLEIFGGGNADV